MGLIIKNRDADLLARELADLTGESLTTAVTEALRDRLERVRAERRSSLAEKLLDIGNDCARRLREPNVTADHGAMLYDEAGLPR